MWYRRRSGITQNRWHDGEGARRQCNSDPALFNYALKGQSTAYGMINKRTRNVDKIYEIKHVKALVVWGTPTQTYRLSITICSFQFHLVTIS